MLISCSRSVMSLNLSCLMNGCDCTINRSSLNIVCSNEGNQETILNLHTNLTDYSENWTEIS